MNKRMTDERLAEIEADWHMPISMQDESDEVLDELLQALKAEREEVKRLVEQGRAADKIYGEQSIALSRALDTIADQRSKIAKLEAGYREAIEDIEAWGAYAGTYFQMKHDLEGTLKEHCDIINASLQDNQ